MGERIRAPPKGRHLLKMSKPWDILRAFYLPVCTVKNARKWPYSRFYVPTIGHLDYGPESLIFDQLPNYNILYSCFWWLMVICWYYLL
jgi:hypothetical protein